MAKNQSDNIIGIRTRFKGRFMIPGSLRIDGIYEGSSLEVDSLTIGKTGKVKTTIKANNVIVEGVVIGSIKAGTRVLLLPSARILGDITTPELIIQNGVVFDGRCKIINDSEGSAVGIVNQAFKEE